MATTPEQAAKALRIAAERMGRNNHAAALAKATPAQIKACREGKRALYSPTPEHRQVIEAIEQVLTGEITPNDEMGLLHQYDVKKQRGL